MYSRTILLAAASLAVAGMADAANAAPTQILQQPLAARVIIFIVVHILEAFVQLADFVIGERPIAGVAGEPKFNVAKLLQGHDLAEAGACR